MPKFFDETEFHIEPDMDVRLYVDFKAPSLMGLQQMNEMTIEELQKYLLTMAFMFGKQMEGLGFRIMETGIQKVPSIKDIM